MKGIPVVGSQLCRKQRATKMRDGALRRRLPEMCRRLHSTRVCTVRDSWTTGVEINLRRSSLKQRPKKR